MNDIQKDLLKKLIRSFLMLLFICLAIALLINIKFNKDFASVIVAMLGVCATLYAPVAAFFFYDSWKDQHNTKLCSDIAQRIWKNLELVSSLTHDPSRKFNRLWELNREDFNNLQPYILNIMSELTHTVIEIKSDLKLLDALLEKDIFSNLNSNFKNFTYDGTKESIDIFHKLQEEYNCLFTPYQKEVKVLLIPIIKA